KRAILLGFRRTSLQAMPAGDGPPFFDKPAYPPRSFALADGVRLVPGGTAVRRGAFVAKGVVVMPPAYVNVGAFVDTGTMVDSHALVGSCAQIGRNVHLSAGAQIGGVLEPAHASPVVVEDGAFVGALCGVFEGFVVRERAVLAAGVVLTAASVVHDLVHGRALRGEIPAGAVVVPGTRPAAGEHAQRLGLQLATPVVVKYRDERTDAATALEQALR
ncbi:MAG: 2,3,4,5-tetrahydropyridine-2,6-dicarboxylate N-succinyltransferase, partial [Planctomycetes bacterium]|nr:2,3,4,5-tetrahydropyridine-2,6-dicarboxylate N-succinyltransferase [Planctomycetota bacterium]